MSAYRVEPRDKKAGKRGQWYVVICPGGAIANNYWHPTEKSANRHCENLNAFWGKKLENE